MMFYRTVPSGTEYESFLDAVPTAQGGLVLRLFFYLYIASTRLFYPIRLLNTWMNCPIRDNIWVENMNDVLSNRAVRYGI
jgi:hypothetical protein